MVTGLDERRVFCRRAAALKNGDWSRINYENPEDRRRADELSIREFAGQSKKRSVVNARSRWPGASSFVVFLNAFSLGVSLESVEEAWPCTEKLPGTTQAMLAADCRELESGASPECRSAAVDRFWQRSVLDRSGWLRRWLPQIHGKDLGADQLRHARRSTIRSP